jgi:biofilm PGA synthesis N-glycosyltransferase PgaC
MRIKNNIKKIFSIQDKQDDSGELSGTNDRQGNIKIDLQGSQKGDTKAAPLTPGSALADRMPYLKIKYRFILSVVFALLWASFSAWLALPWINDLADVLSWPVAIFIIAGLAVIPGYVTAYLLATILLDRSREIPLLEDEKIVRWPSVALIIAAYNEEDKIASTIEYALRSDYRGPLQIVVVDDGSSDSTADIVSQIAKNNFQVRLFSVRHGGKAAALNASLNFLDEEIICTIDADTLLMEESVSRIVARYLTQEVAAVAGSVMVRNSRENIITRLQEWDYFMGIASIKRSQGLWQAALVAQGAFSLYNRLDVIEVGGWPDMIGEDIGLTWALLDANKNISYESTAVAFTIVPQTVKALFRQRSRWARGMIEGLKMFGPSLLLKHNKASHGILINCLFPVVDICYTFAFLPGVVLALTGNFLLVGPITLMVLPLSLLLSYVMFSLQRKAFREDHLRIRQNRRGYLFYILFYQAIVSPAALRGYAQQLLSRQRRW